MAKLSDSQKIQVVSEYRRENPDKYSSSDIALEIAEKHGFSHRGVIAALINAGVYINKKGDTSTRSKTNRSLTDLKNIFKLTISSQNGIIIPEILESFTKKQLQYILQLLTEREKDG